MTIFTALEYPTRAYIWADEMYVNNLTRALTIDGLQIANMYQTTFGNNGDFFTAGFFLAAGTYTVTVVGVTNSSFGKADWLVDGASATTGQDWYSASITRNVIKTFSLTIAAGGYHTLQVTVNGKNASSSGFTLGFTKIFIVSASDMAGVTTTSIPIIAQRSTFIASEIANVTQVTVDTAQEYNYYNHRSSPANGDIMSVNAFLRAGPYYLNILGVTNATYGIIDWYVDNVLNFAGTDWYSASIGHNILKTAVVQVLTDGCHYIKGVVNGKDASSSGFDCGLTKIYFIPAGGG